MRVFPSTTFRVRRPPGSAVPQRTNRKVAWDIRLTPSGSINFNLKNDVRGLVPFKTFVNFLGAQQR